MTDTAEPAPGWDARPWEAVTDAALAPALAVPTMLSQEEGQLYHWLGTRAQGLGATVDLGAFAGGSSARLLSGLALSGRPYHLHAYDRFQAKASTRARFLPGTDASDRDILPLARANLAPWAPHVTLHPGDIAAQRWTGGPVEILAIDAAKSPALADHIAAEFYPALIPGRSVVIHQDFLHDAQPWLAVQMLRLGDAMQLVGRAARDVAVFEPLRPVTAADLAAAQTAGLDDSALISALRTAADHWPGAFPRARFMAMIRRIKANPGVRVAWQMWRKPAPRA